MTGRHIALVGSGAFARSICEALAGLAPAHGDGEAIHVTVLARNTAAVTGIVQHCIGRAAVRAAAIAFVAETLDDEAEAIGRLRPDLLVCCASVQSPYEKTTQPSQWTRLIEEAGFGVTLPLQTVIAMRLAKAIAAESPDTLLVNGCLPDAVNPVLAALGLPIHCGIGNVATVAACLQAELGRPDQSSLAVLAQHGHLAVPENPADEALAWLDGKSLSGVTELLAVARARPRRELNGIGGHSAAQVLLDLSRGTTVATNLPGPLGLPGGYPVRLHGNSISLNLPTDITAAQAIEWNTRAGRLDGIEIRGGQITHLARAQAALAPYLSTLAAGWSAAEIDEAYQQIHALRRRLRLAQPSPV